MDFPKITMNGAKYQLNTKVLEEGGVKMPVVELIRESGDGVQLSYYMHPSSPRDNFMTSFRKGDNKRMEISSRSRYSYKGREMNRVDSQALDAALRYYINIINDTSVPEKEKQGLALAMFEVVSSVKRDRFMGVI